MLVVFGLTGACLPSYAHAAAASVTLNAVDSWKNTGIQVAAGDAVAVQAQRLIRYYDAISINSNGEWLYCWNKDYWKKADEVRNDPARPLPSAPGGALIFKVGNGQPFFIPSSAGTPGKDHTAELTMNGYTKLRGYSSALSHQFTAQESGFLFVSVNLSAKAKSVTWTFPNYAIKVFGKLPTERQISGKVTDENGQNLAEVEVQAGDIKKISGADGSFLFTVEKDGKYPVKFSKTGYLPSETAAAISLAAGGFLDMGSISLRPIPGRVSGKVLGEDGKVVAGALVRIGVIQAVTDKSGIFSAQVNKGVYAVKASKALPSGIAASGEKANVGVLTGQETNAGTIVISPSISGAAGWMGTSRFIQKGQIVVVKAGGEITKAAQKFGPEGLKGKSAGTGAVLPGEALGALVAKIGSGKPFLVGEGKRFQAADAGTLYFAVNAGPVDSKGLSGMFTFGELTVLDLGDIEGSVIGANGKPLVMATVEVSGIKESLYTDSNGKFLLTDVPANKVYGITVTFPGYNPYVRNLVVQRGQRASMGRVAMQSAPVMGLVVIKLLPKSGSTGGLIPVFAEVTNTSARNGLWGGYLISLKARALASGKEYPGMSPTYLVLAPGEKRGTELICHLPSDAPAGAYAVTAELRVPETVSIQDAAKQFEAKKELADKLGAIKEVTGKIVSQNTRNLSVVAGTGGANIPAAARLLLPTITPKVFSPAKGQLVTGKIALREKAIVVLGKEIEIFKDKSGAPLLIWNSYEGLYMSAKEDGARKDDWLWIGQSNVQSDDFTVSWDTTKIPDGDYLIKATMKTVYDGKPIEGSMTVMVKVRNDPRTGVIKGKIIGENGAALPGVAVKRLARNQSVGGLDWNTLETKSEVGWEAEDVATTAGDGSYVFSGVMSGAYRLEYSLDKYIKQTRDITLKAGMQFDAGTAALPAEKCGLAGTVRLDDAAKAGGVLVSLQGPSAASVQAGDDGKFSFEGLKNGTYKVFASRDEYDMVSAGVLLNPGESKKLGEFILKRRLGSLAGTARDEAGNPLAGVSVTLDRAAAAATGKDGRFAFSNVARGEHALALAKSGCELAEAKLQVVRSTPTTDAGEFIIRKVKGQVAGRVTNARGGAAVAGAALTFALQPDGAVNASVLADDKGDYIAPGLSAGIYRVTAAKDGFSDASGLAEVKANETAKADFQLAEAFGGIRGVVGDADSRLGLDDVTVTVAGTDVLGMSHFDSFGAPPGTLMGRSGAFELSGISAGKRSVRFSAPLYEPKVVEINIRKNQTPDLGEVWLKKDRTVIGGIKGKVLAASGQPVNRAVVLFKSVEPRKMVTTAADGSFSLSELPKGRQEVSASYPGYKTAQVSVEVRPGVMQEVTFKLEKMSEKVSGTITLLSKPDKVRTGVTERIFFQVQNTMPRAQGLPIPFYVEMTARNRATGEEFKNLAPTVITVEEGSIHQTQLLLVMPVKAAEGTYEFTARLMTADVSAGDAAQSGQVVSEAKGTYAVVKGPSSEELARLIQLIPPAITPELITPSKGRIITGAIKVSEYGIVGWGQKVEVVNSQTPAGMGVRDASGRFWSIDNITNKYWHRRYDPTTGKKDDWVWLGESTLFGDNFEVGWDTGLLEDGDYEVRARMTALVTPQGANEGRAISGEAVIPVKIRNKALQGSIKGQVTDADGVPLAGAGVKRSGRKEVITGADPAGQTVSRTEWLADEIAFTDVNGSYEFTGLLAGSYLLSYAKEGYVPGGDKQADVKSGAVCGVARASLAALNGSIVGAVADEAGAPLAGVEVLGTEQKIFTGADGRYEIRNLKPAKYMINYRKDGYFFPDPSAPYDVYKEGSMAAAATAGQEITVLAGKEAQAARLRLCSNPGGVKGQVTSSDGKKAVSGAEVRLDAKDKTFLPTDASGLFQSGPARKGSYQLTVSKSGFYPKTFTADIQPGITLDLGAIALDPVTGRVEVNVSPASAQTEIAGSGNRSGPQAVFEALIPGKYAVKVTADGYEDLRSDLEVRPGETSSINVQLNAKPGKALGKVADNRGVPLNEVKVFIGAQQVAVTKADGAFATGEIGAGKYAVEYVKAGCERRTDEIQIRPGKDTDLGTVGLQLMPGVVKGAITPGNGEVSIDGKKAGLTNGAFEARLEPGRHSLKCSAPRHKGLEKELTVNPAETIAADCNLTENPGRLEGSVTPADSAVRVDGTAVPVGANGAFSKELTPGKHTFSAERENYYPASLELVIEAEETAKAALALKEKTARISGTMFPSDKGAWASIDGKKIEVRNGAFSAEVPLGAHSVSAEARAYRPYRKDLALKAEEEASLEIILEPKPARLAFKVTPADADILIDGAAVQPGQSGVAEVSPGRHQVVVSREDYEQYSEELEAGPDTDREIRAVLNIKFGAVFVSVTPASARVIVDGAELNRSDGVLQTSLPPGRHTVSASAQDYEDYKAEVTVAPGKTAAVSIALKPSKGGLAGKVIPANSDVAVDGVPVVTAQGGRYELASLAPGEHTLTVSRKNFETFLAKPVITAGQTLELDVKLIPSKGGLKLRVQPGNASVSVGGIPAQLKEGEGLTALAPGKYLVTVQAAGYEAFEQEIEIRSSEDVSIDLTLKLLPGTVTAALSPADAEVLIDDKTVAVEKGMIRLEVAPGKHTLKASQAKSEPYQAEFEIGAGEVKNLEVRLEAKKVLLLTFSADPAQALLGEFVTLSAQSSLGDAAIELSAEKGRFEGAEGNTLKGVTDAKGAFAAKWAAWTPGKYNLRAKASKDKVSAEKEAGVEVTFAVPEIDALIKDVKGSFAVGDQIDVMAVVKNLGKVSGRYRFEIELKGNAGLPVFMLKAKDVNLSAGETKAVAFEWNVRALGLFDARVSIALVGDNGEIKRLRNVQGKLDLSLVAEMEGKITLRGGKVYFTPVVRGMQMDYEISDPAGKLGLEKHSGKIVRGECRVLSQFANKGLAAFTEPPVVVR